METISPIYIDGPLAGQERKTDSHFVVAMKYREPTIQDFSPGDRIDLFADEVYYQMRQCAFTSQGSRQAFVVWVAWCGPYSDPPIHLLVNYLWSNTAQARGKYVDMPPR